MKIDPKLVEGIPLAKGYESVLLKLVESTYTEDQFQKDRANWYQNHFVTDYEQNGHKDPKWDHFVLEFLAESARRVSITRDQRHRSPKFYHEEFDDHLADDGEAILNFGCKDSLVHALLIEELLRQKRHAEVKANANNLAEFFEPAPHTDFVNFLIARVLLKSNNGMQVREGMTHHFRHAITDQELTSLDRRILYEEAKMMMAPVHSSIMGQFIISLEREKDADPWLKNMILGNFFNNLAIDAGNLSTFWPPYEEVFELDPSKAKAVHMGHLRKAYRLY